MVTLAKAAFSGNIDMIQHLVAEEGAVINSSVINEAVRGCRTESLKVLRELGASLCTNNYNPYATAIESQQRNLKRELPVFRDLVALGVDINAFVVGHATPATGEVTPLALAGGWYDISVVRALLNAGADVNAPCGSGCTPLLLSLKMGHHNKARLLIENGAHVNVSAWGGKTPLHFAVKFPDMIDALIDRGANTEAADDNGETPLFLALGVTNSDKASLALMRRGANPITTNKGGRTSLMQAVRYSSSLWAVKSIIIAGADINARRNPDDACLLIAIDKQNADLVCLLLEHGADVNIRNKKGQFALQLAVQGYNDGSSDDSEANAARICSALMNHGADPEDFSMNDPIIRRALLRKHRGVHSQSQLVTCIAQNVTHTD